MPLLVTMVLLDWLLLLYTRTVGAAINEGIPVAEQAFGTLIATGLTLLVWRRSRIAWGLKVVLGGWALVALVLGGDTWPAYLVPIVLIIATQMAALLSPAVRKHIARPRVPDPSHASGSA
ncbi:hypothetical protein [Actinopolymorpha alba]|uniref:hypothetical protein n=1 Tax=Actinopolymorpha alba TaxID=533267 RepID=UPI000371C92B|nr:hypothetical protein [Actinopolymorpha alba]